MSATELAENDEILLKYILEQSRREAAVANHTATQPQTTWMIEESKMERELVRPTPTAAIGFNHTSNHSTITTTTTSSSSTTALLTPSERVDREFRRFLVQSLPKTRFVGPRQTTIFVKYIIREDAVRCLFEFTSAFAQYLLTRAFEGLNQLPDVGIPLGSSQDYPFSPHQIHTQWPDANIYENMHGHSADVLNDMGPENHHKLFYSGHTIRLRTLREFHKPNYTQTDDPMTTLVQYFFDRFQAIAPSKLPSVLNDPCEHAVLGAILKHWLEWLLNESRRRSRSRGRDSRAEAQEILLIDLWNVIHDQLDPASKSMRELYKYLHVGFDAKMTAADPWTYGYYGCEKPWSMTPYETVLRAETSNVQTEMNKLNATSWYMNPHQLLSYAQAFARGQCHEEEAFLADLRQFNVRILQYHGLQTNLIPPVLRQRDWGQRPTPRSFVSLAVTDADGVDFRFLFSMGDSNEGLFQSLDTGESLYRITSFARTISIASVEPVRYPWSLFNKFRLNLNPAQQILLTQLQGIRPLMEDVIQVREGQTCRSSSVTSFADPVTIAAREHAVDTRYGKWNRQNYLQQNNPLELSDIVSEIENGFKQEFFHDIIGTMLPTLEFSRLGPSFYEENHPTMIKRQFHSHFMDTCLSDAGFQPLPTVLSQLISDYYMIPIPFITKEAEKQMSAFAPLQRATRDSSVGSLMGGWVKLDNQPQWIESNQEINKLRPQKE